MKKTFLVFFLLVLSFYSFSQQKKFTREDTLRGSLSAERKCFDVYFYELSIAVNPNRHFISGENKIYFTAQEDFTTLQLDLFKEISIVHITDSKNKNLSYERKGNSFFVRFGEIQKKGTQSFITVAYEGEPHTAINPPWDGGFIWTTDSLGRSWTAVACEGVGASLWWPCKDHPSDEPDSMKMHFEVPAELFCASNGNLISTQVTEKNTRIYSWKVSYPINTYNITLNIGHYIHISDGYIREDKSTLELDYYVLSYNKEKAKQHFEQVKSMLPCYEKLWGKYPFEKDGYALIESPYWGMEHQSAIAYGNRFKNNMVGLDYIIVHESGHEWWGNYLSISDHADLWIHEAFTTYGETLLLECLYNKEAAEKYLAGQKKLIRNREAIVGPSDVNYHYWMDSDMYYKGAWMLHTLRSSLDNDSLWFALLKNIQLTFGGKQIRSGELIRHINSLTKFDYTSFFRQYLYETELPELEYILTKKDSHTYKLKYRWVASVKNFSLPIVIQENNGVKKKLYPSEEFKTVLINIDNPKAEFIFNKNAYYINLTQKKK